jgi:hypothetical protein
MLPGDTKLMFDGNGEVVVKARKRMAERDLQDIGPSVERSVGKVVHGQTLRGGINNLHDSASGEASKPTRLRALDGFSFRKFNVWPAAAVVAVFVVWGFAIYFIAWAFSAADWLAP